MEKKLPQIITCLMKNSSLQSELEIDQFQACLESLGDVDVNACTEEDFLQLFLVFDDRCYEEPHYPMASLANVILSIQYFPNMDTQRFTTFVLRGLSKSLDKAPRWTKDFIGGIINNSLASGYQNELARSLTSYDHPVLSQLFSASANNILELIADETDVQHEEEKEKLRSFISEIQGS